MSSISIVIPFYNGIEFISDTIQSVLSQTYPHFEVLIGVNGHAIDSPIWNQVHSFVTDSRIRIKHYENPEDILNKKSATLNQMINDCSYDIICMLDADDLWLPNKLEKQMEIWNTNKYDLIGTGGYTFGTHSYVIQIPMGDISNINALENNPIINSSSMFRKIDAHWSTDTIVEDYDMWLRMYVLKKRIYNIAEVLTLHRLHPTSAFNGKNDDEAKRIRKVWSERNPVTLVTAYYAIPSKFPSQTYLVWIKNFLEAIPCHLIIYTDETMLPILQSMRTPYLERTKFIVRPFNELYMSRLMNVWQKHKQMDHEHYHTEYLYILWNEKTKFVMDTIEMNPFKSDYFFWCDIGAFRTPEHLPYLVNFPNPDTVYRLNASQIYILQINPFNETELEKGTLIPIYDFKYDIRVGGGIFGGHKSAWCIWDKKYYEMLKWFIEHNRFAGKDQNIMASVYIMNRDLVTLINHKPYLNNGDKWFYMEFFLS